MTTLVVKIGTSSLTSPGGQLALSTIATLVETLAERRAAGDRVVLVSSGAVGVGCARLGVERPRRVPRKQAIAAIGQGRLIRVYDDLFANLGQAIAQVLLTRRDLMERASYVNAYNAFQELFELGAIPIVNENDTIATDELKFGDNDTLSALVASLLEADWLILLTDVDRLYSSDPRLDPSARPIRTVSSQELDTLQVDAGNSGSDWGTGGMATKLAAARVATSAGVRAAIAHGRDPRVIANILAGEPYGTQFEPQPRAEPARKRWIAHGLLPSGSLRLDWGAVRALRDRGKSLLAAGIAAIEGDFQTGDAVILHDPDGTEIGRGLVNYNCGELQQIRGQPSSQIAAILGYAGSDTAIHRDNLVLTPPHRPAPPASLQSPHKR